MSRLDPRRHQERLTGLLAVSLSGVVLSVFLAISLAGKPSASEIAIRLTGTAVAAAFLFLLVTRHIRRRAALRRKPFPPAWESILNREVPFFRALDEPEKARFREEVQLFLNEKRITGIKTSVDDTVRVLVAASAIIPIFGFPGWEWDQISEILIYPSTFNDQYEMGREQDHDVLGMVGSGAMNRMMILSKPDLLRGFRLPQDKKNVGIHEFVHLLDKSDGAVDGVPDVGLPAKAVGPWLKFVHEEMARIQRGQSDIKPYGLTNEGEFFAVASEYFFEGPEKMKRKHPELYGMLERIFHQDPQSRFKKSLAAMVRVQRSRLGRNSPCPCGSGQKYKRCCLGSP